MITISLTLNVQLDATDLVAFDARLAALARGMERFTEATKEPQSHTEPTASVDLRAVSAASVNPDPTPETPPTADGLSLPKPQNAPTRPRAASRPPKTPAPQRTPVLPPVFPATTNGNSNGHATEPEPTHGKPEDTPTDANDPPHPSNRLPFAEFDRLVRAEMKRLSMDGRLPGHKLWNNERSPQLPTLAAVILRYGVTTLADLAPKFGLQPPLSVVKEREP